MRKLYSIFDKQCGRYLSTGLNSKTYKSCVEEGINYLLSDIHNEPMDDDDKQILKLRTSEKAQFLANHEFIIEEHNEEIEENYY